MASMGHDMKFAHSNSHVKRHGFIKEVMGIVGAAHGRWLRMGKRAQVQLAPLLADRVRVIPHCRPMKGTYTRPVWSTDSVQGAVLD